MKEQTNSYNSCLSIITKTPDIDTPTKKLFADNSKYFVVTKKKEEREANDILKRVVYRTVETKTRIKLER